MTIILLALVALFALVVTSRPILPDSDLSDVAFTPSTLQNTPQAGFQILPGKDVDTTRLQLQKSMQRIGDLNVEDVVTIASFEMSPQVASAPDTPLDSTAGTRSVLDIEDRVDAPVADDRPTTAPFVVLAYSCVAALLALTCIALTLYIVKSLRSRTLALKTAWELLPRIWKRSSTQNEMSATTRKWLLHVDRLPPRTDYLLGAEEGSPERLGDKPLYFDADLGMESESDDIGEKYQDALDTTPLPSIHDLPLEDNVSDPSHVSDPPLPPTGSRYLDQPTGDRSTPLMRESCFSPILRPAWSVRAIDAPALGLSVYDGDGVTYSPQPLVHPRRRAYRSAVPELDIALAMQLRPGLGLGADSAWMVRFLMTIFGWFAVALTGRTQ